ncbi:MULTISPECIES: patatin-like phospholipase family protein [Rhizobium]|jgi:NTE family protein|uniref:patatin-like phospholipase family protein n=1 Tax=Rhizobium TaxID=379 RepID=UPI00036808BB|nr:patatin-like phospholipase family protein [Rhizobium ruizarguesonis]TAZ86956.1 patatin-like phospholipase family protein [Rhizobium ruizarguesonis]TBA31944.1 patatin-like phospholipase family protein [Rhizobium ruizarguesonis]TBA50955.1 patatin-like phospholipase family protein [Rhizobium ruizarguesonis]TBA95545.1 patatin-like phospholipase family protein [Rhizobium ruizarguesonis]TBB36607.1 patatin-like phospholipase family protein [Rhizobium ruizarguesonis]
MAVSINGKAKTIGIALSGGGFRAAAFHLGVFTELRALNLLDKLDLLTCVSGGSIAGGFLASNWNVPDVLDRLADYLSKKSIAVSSVVGGLISPFSTRLEKLAETYDRDLFEGRTLSDLRGGPRIYFNATNLATGNMFFFVAGKSLVPGGDSGETMGEHESGTASASNFSISRAVAASSAFPPVFPPLKIDADVYPNALTEYVTLTDGGVYDNLGINPLLRTKWNPLDYCIVSDGGKPFAITSEPTESGTIVLKEAINILMEQVRGLQFSRLQLAHQAEQGPKPLWFSLDSTEGEATSGDAAFASLIGTNLKSLNTHEMGVLIRHGRALVRARLQRYTPELLSID